MEIYVGFLFSIVMLSIAYVIAKTDYFNPSVIFSALNVAALFMCIVLQKEYDINLHMNTIAVLILGQIIFCVVSFFYNINSNYRRHNKKVEFTYISIDKKWMIAFFVFQILVGISTLRYIIAVSSSVYGNVASFAAYIANYHSATVFRAQDVSAAGVNMGIFFRFGTPVLEAFTYILLAIIMVNYEVTKHIDKTHITAVILSCIISLMSGARSGVFRYLTAALAAGIIIHRRAIGSFKKGSFKTFSRIILLFIAFTIFVLATRSLVGRSTTFDSTWYRAFFPYFGAPIVNLDTYLNSSNAYQSKIWGEQTFYQFYSFLSSEFNIDKYTYSLNLPFLWSNGISTGNVYTMYYMFIEDFGYWGVVPLTFIIALYYIKTYTKLMNLKSQKSPMCVSFFIYMYMFNSLIMLLFSNRFYEHILNYSILKMFFCIFILWKLLKMNLFSGKRFRKHEIL